MWVHRDIQQLPLFKNAVITVGAFDGIHYGHRQIIRQLKEEAKRCNGESVIITFDPHPMQILSPERKASGILNTLPEKIYLLQKEEIDHLVIVPFTHSFSLLSATEYVNDFLVSKFHPHIIITGYDHHFGHNREGDIHLLERMATENNFKVTEIPPQILHDLTVSSTKIRSYLQTGEVRKANELLGYSYFISGEVIHGDKRGRQLGFPTANISLSDLNKLIPAEGVYAVGICMPSPVTGNPESNILLFKGAANIGRLPTFGKHELRLEVNIFDFDRDIYGTDVQISFCNFIRKDQKFDSVQQLQKTMQDDVRKIKDWFLSSGRGSCF